MIVAGESSGELYGSLLARELRGKWPDIRLMGIGGERMRDAGVDLFSGISGAFGATELVSSVMALRESFKKAVKTLERDPPDIFVPIDFPDFNFRLARRARQRGCKVLYYVSPHVWAWRKGRVMTMREIADKVAVILPFEEELYRKAGVPCEFVGHPVTEEIEEYEADHPGVKAWIDGEENRTGAPVIALLPGSRPHELKGLLPLFVALVTDLEKRIPGVRFLLPFAPNIDSGRFSTPLQALRDRGVTVLKGEAVRALAEADLAVIASGTATLQAALLGRPMVVVYKLSALSYFLGRMLLDVKYISLVNIIPDTLVVSELIQQRARPEHVVAELRRIMDDDAYRRRMVEAFRRIRMNFAGRHPSRRVAELAGELAGWKAVP